MNDDNEGILTIAHIECMVRGGGWNFETVPAQFETTLWRQYQVWKEDGNELWIVRPDGLRRAWTFKLGSIVEVSPQAVQFRSRDIITELSVDEDEQRGETPKPKLPPNSTNTRK